MITRKAYMNQEATHGEYLRDILNAAGVPVDWDVTLPECDAHIMEWDRKQYLVRTPAIFTALKDRGDFMTLAVGMCLLKEIKRGQIALGL